MVDAVAGPLVGLLGRVVEGMWRARRPPAPRPVGMLADLLADAVFAQWRQEAAERMLLTPAPIPVCWSLSELAVTGPVEAAVGDPERPSPFPALPGQSRVTTEQLGAGGGRRELFAVYAGIASGRLVVVGAPGAGKTGSAVLLVLDALEQRKGVEDSKRARVPVPVLVTAHDWDPVSCSAREWLVDQLIASYPLLFAHRGGGAEADALVAAGAVALVLDGLDEMDLVRRSAALRTLSDAPFRMVVLTRIDEMVEAAGVAWLVGALALQLREVTGPEGAEYLHRARSGPPPSGWAALLTYLRDNPDGVLTRGLATPLALTLVRDTYGSGDDLSGLLTTCWRTTGKFEWYLIARVLPAAYTHRPGRPAPCYNQALAEQVLVFLARQMNRDDTRDLAWWQIPHWLPVTSRIVVNMLAAGFLGGALSGLVFVVGDLLASLLFSPAPNLVQVLRPGSWTVLGGSLLSGLAFGFGVGLPLGVGFGRGGREPQRVRKWRDISWRSVITAGLVYGLVSGLLTKLLIIVFIDPPGPDLLGTNLIDFVRGLAVNLVGGLALGLALGFSGWRCESQDMSQHQVKSRHVDRLFGLTAALVLGLAAGIMAMHSFDFGLGGGFAVGLAVLPGFRLMSWLAGGVVAGLAVGSADNKPSPSGPHETWRNDRTFRIRVGLGFGLWVGLGVGLGWALGFGVVFGVVLMSGLAFGFSVALTYGITSSMTWSTTLAWHQLQRTHGVPAVALMPFLEDARRRGVLRTVGATYQFRHATLQDLLAGCAFTSPPTSTAAQIKN